MSSDELLVDAAAVMAAKTSLDGIHRSLESGFRSLASEVEALLRDGWLGASAGKFSELFQTARGELEQLLSEAGQIAATVPKAVDSVVGSDQSRADGLSKTRSSLDL